MNRRDVLKNLGFVAGGILLFPSCDFTDEKVSILLNKLQINAEEEKIVKQLVGTILPETEIPGGVSLKVHNFVWVMIDDCTPKQQQDSFLNGLRMFNQKVRKNTGSNFIKLNSEEKLNALQTIYENKKEDENVRYFLNTTKRFAVSGYLNSEYILTEQMPYKLVPGAFSYQTCIPTDLNSKINTNG